MANFIIKIKDMYLEWSTIVDAPVTFGMDSVEFRAYYAEQYGLEGVRGLPERLERVEKNGTSSYLPATPEDLILANCAGPDETSLSIDEIYQAYCLRKPIRDGWMVPVEDEEEE